MEIGIDSISLNPDTVLKTTRHVLEVEKRLNRRPRQAASRWFRFLPATLYG
jgi:pyruvate, water dikinase